MRRNVIKIAFSAFHLLLLSVCSIAQTVVVTVDGTSGLTQISPWIYGRNNNLSDNASSSMSADTWHLYKDAGLRFFRENGGNNATKYNWRAKLSSHPDWYNNVYDHDWNYSAKTLLDNTQNTQGLFAFQLIGYAASNKNYNFNDWGYNQSQWSAATSNNWAGGGGPTSVGGNGGIGNPGLYLKEWPADSTVGILSHWFNDLGYDSTRFRYWNMDNEPEIWNSTHDDVVTTTIAAESFIQKYVAVAKAARAKFPGIKLCGPVSPNEWQWYSWNNGKIIDSNGIKYTWLEYFIKRIGEEQDASGMKLLDVIDLHFYPGTENDAAATLQLHRVWFDSLYSFSGANGVKLAGTNDWNSDITQEYVFGRCENWLRKYMGQNHGVKFAISEYGAVASTSNTNPNIIACWYASHLGIFANKGVEYFTPWDWYKGQWEVMNLFSNYYGKLAVQATSTDETNISAYASVSSAQDSLIVVVVNRNQSGAQTVNIQIKNFNSDLTTVPGLQLAGMVSNTETYISKTSNALQKKTYSLSNKQISFSAPSLSVTLLQIPQHSVATATEKALETKKLTRVYPNPANDHIVVETDSNTPSKVFVLDLLGILMGTWDITSYGKVDISALHAGCYLVKVQSVHSTVSYKICKE